MSNASIDLLAKEFQKIGNDHLRSIRRTHARNVLGSSVIRVFAKGTKEELVEHLQRIEIDELRNVPDAVAFSAWFDRQLGLLAEVVRRRNESNKRVNPGLQWGHTSKVLCLYCNAMVLWSRYFSDDDEKRLREFLYVPLDGVIIRKLKSLDYPVPFNKIKEIETREDFHRVQADLATAAKRHNVPRVWFDDNWSDRLASGDGSLNALEKSN